MLKILLIDSWLLNNKVIEQDSQEYLEDHHIKFEFFEATTTEEAFNTLMSEKIDIVFIDISSEAFDGIKLLEKIKQLEIKQPEIIAVTVLYDKKFRYEALRLKVYKYIYKPYDYNEIERSLESYIKQHERLTEFVKSENDTKDENDEDDFDFDFGNEEEEDDFDFDLDDEDDEKNNDDLDKSKELMDRYNQSHKKTSAKEFLQEYEDVGYDTEELTDLEEDLDALVASILFDEDLEDKINDIVNIFEKYHKFLYTFSEFEELYEVIHSLETLLSETNFFTLKKKKMVTKLIIAIIEDLVDWKEHVFVEKDAVDVFYINASILNSYILLKDIIK